MVVDQVVADTCVYLNISTEEGSTPFKALVLAPQGCKRYTSVMQDAKEEVRAR